MRILVFDVCDRRTFRDLGRWLSVARDAGAIRSIDIRPCTNVGASVIYCGWTKSCTILKPWQTIVCLHLQANHHSRVFLAGAGFRPSTVLWMVPGFLRWRRISSICDFPPISANSHDHKTMHANIQRRMLLWSTNLVGYSQGENMDSWG